MGVGPTAASAMRADSIRSPAPFSNTEEATPATAMSISLRGMKRWYAAPNDDGGKRYGEADEETPRAPGQSAPGPAQKSLDRNRTADLRALRLFACA